MYLVKRGSRAGNKWVAHLWTGEDTVCRMASTGGLNRRRYLIAANPIHISPSAKKTDLPICCMCQNVSEQHELF